MKDMPRYYIVQDGVEEPRYFRDKGDVCLALIQLHLMPGDVVRNYVRGALVEEINALDFIAQYDSTIPEYVL